MRHYELVSRSTQMNCPAGFQIMYAQLGSVSDANARLPKMSVIENKIPNTIPVSTVFIVKTPRNVRHISLGRACQKCAVGAVSSVTEAICRAYTPGAVFYPKAKIACSNVSRAAGSRLPRPDVPFISGLVQSWEPLSFRVFAEQIASEIVAADRHNRQDQDSKAAAARSRNDRHYQTNPISVGGALAP